jgi:putative ATP-binding cassette transporter
MIVFLVREGGLLRSPVFLYVLAASSSRTAMIYLVNETAAQGGADIAMFVLLMTAVIVSLASSHLARLCGIQLNENMAAKLRRRMSDQVLNADVSFFQSREHGQLYTALAGHTGAVGSATLRVVEIVQALLLLIFSLSYLFYQSWQAGIACLVALTLGVLAFYLSELPARKMLDAANASRIAFYDTVNDLLRGYKELRLRQARRLDVSARANRVINETRDRSIQSERYFSYGQVAASASLSLLLVAIVVLLPAVINADSVAILQVVTVILFSFGPIEAMVSDLPGLARASVSFRHLREVEAELTQNPEAEGVRNSVDTRPTFESVELRGVTAVLSRPTKAPGSEARDTFTLGPIDLTLRPGQSIFITGGNGMGKSTLLQILTGLRHADAGEILFNGVPVTRESVGDYRGLFSAVFSEFYLFRHLYGLTPDERERLQVHIEELGLAEGVSIVDDSFSSLSLSTGQMRRLALSIALAEQRPIIVLDEFAADQDPVRRAFFYDVLVPRLAKAGHLVIAVTHDEHCFGKSDRLIRMEDGKIMSDTVKPTGAKSLAGQR